MSGMMKFNRIMGVIFGFLVGFGGLAWVIIGISQGQTVDIFSLVLIVLGLGAFFWGIRELRSKEMTPLGKEKAKN